jgi:hypothetical protein
MIRRHKPKPVIVEEPQNVTSVAQEMALRYNEARLRFEFFCPIEQKEIPKKAGLWFDNTAVCWHTAIGRKPPSKSIQRFLAAKLVEYADEETKKLIGRQAIRKAQEMHDRALLEEEPVVVDKSQPTHEENIAWLKSHKWCIVDWNIWRDPLGKISDGDIFHALDTQRECVRGR